jgi:hypothetical protein
MPTPPSAHRKQTIVLATLVGLAIAVMFVLARLGGFGGLRGALSSITFGADNFLCGPLASAESAPLPAGTHGIFTCPASLGANEVWLGPSAFSNVSGLKIYEYTTTFSQEKDAVSPVWPGERYGFGGSALPGLTVFKPGRTYYVQASQQFGFRCSGPAPVSSSSSSAQCSGALCPNSQVCVNGICLPCDNGTNVCPALMVCNSGVCVSDQLSSSSSSSSSSTVTANQPPVFNNLNTTYNLTVGQPFSLALDVTDPETDSVRFLMASRNMMAGPIHLDVNGDTYVDGTDYNLIESLFGKHTGDSGFLASADLNPNGVIQELDLLAFVGGVNSVNLGGSSFDQTTGELTWTPTTPGTYIVSMTALNDSFPFPTPFTTRVVTFTVQAGLEAGLLGYWPLNEGNGTISQDVTTGDHDVVFANGATWGSPLTGVGSSTSLNGIDQYVNIGALPLFNFQYNNDFSLGAYAKPSATSTQDGIIVGKVESRGFSFPGWAMTYTADQRFGFKMSGSSFLNPIGLEVKTGTAFGTGAIHHVVVSYNGTNAALAGTPDAVKIYVNGTEFSTARGNLNVTLNTLRSPGGISSIINNGEAQIGMGDAAISPFTGQIDDVKIYDRVIVPTN